MDIPPDNLTHPGDLYRLIYTNSQFEVLFGDSSFGLSQLTEEQRRGRGASAILQVSNFNIKAYYHQSYWTDPVLHYVGGNFGYRLKDPLYPDGRYLGLFGNSLGFIVRK